MYFVMVIYTCIYLCLKLSFIKNCSKQKRRFNTKLFQVLLGDLNSLYSSTIMPAITVEHNTLVYLDTWKVMGLNLWHIHIHDKRLTFVCFSHGEVVIYEQRTVCSCEDVTANCLDNI